MGHWDHLPSAEWLGGVEGAVWRDGEWRMDLGLLGSATCSILTGNTIVKTDLTKCPFHFQT